MADGTPAISELELNLSCPNVENGGHLSHVPEAAEETVGRVKAENSLPVIHNISPTVPNIVRIARAVTSAGADAITIATTVPAMPGQPRDGQAPVGHRHWRPLRPRARARRPSPLCTRASQAVDAPIIGTGGIFNSDHAPRSSSWPEPPRPGRHRANLTNFWAPLEVLDGLWSYMGETAIASIPDLVGVAWKQ